MRTLIILLALAVNLAAEVHSPPATWRGKTIGKTDGNPWVDDKGPRWRLDQVYPDDFTKAENWKPMAWANVQKKDVWFNETGSQGGHPAVAYAGSKFDIGMYSAADNLEWLKTSALVFVAPKDGDYRVKFAATVTRWEGGGTVEVRYFTRAKSADGTEVITRLRVDGMATDVPLTIEGEPGTLAKGDEYAVAFCVIGRHSGASVKISALGILGTATKKK